MQTHEDRDAKGVARGAVFNRRRSVMESATSNEGLQSKGDEGELGARKSNTDSEPTPGAEGPRPPSDEGELAHHDAVEIEIASS